MTVLPIGTPIVFTVGGKRPLQNLAAGGGGPDPGATVAVQVQDLAGNPIGAATPCPAVAGSDGEYQGVSAALALVEGTEYDVVGTATKAGDTIWTARRRQRAGYLTGV